MLRFAFVLAAALALTACAGDPAAPEGAPAEPVSQTDPADLGAEAGEDSPAETATVNPDLPVIQVYSSPTCGCCGLWVDHLREAGFAVTVNHTDAMAAVKDEIGVPPALGSCHTGLVDGYAVEGHVPAEDIIRMLEERPDIAGIAVPGMPIGSPGMEIEGQPAQPYDVIAFTQGDGERSVFASH